MRFKTDENLPVEVTELLRQCGHDALSVIEQQLAGHPDLDVARVCQAEKRALVNLDLDFADMRAYPPSLYSGPGRVASGHADHLGDPAIGGADDSVACIRSVGRTFVDRRRTTRPDQGRHSMKESVMSGPVTKHLAQLIAALPDLREL